MGGPKVDHLKLQTGSLCLVHFRATRSTFGGWSGFGSSKTTAPLVYRLHCPVKVRTAQDVQAKSNEMASEKHDQGDVDTISWRIVTGHSSICKEMV
jgi:hypothetical protein